MFCSFTDSSVILLVDDINLLNNFFHAFLWLCGLSAETVFKNCWSYNLACSSLPSCIHWTRHFLSVNLRKNQTLLVTDAAKILWLKNPSTCCKCHINDHSAPYEPCQPTGTLFGAKYWTARGDQVMSSCNTGDRFHSCATDGQENS